MKSATPPERMVKSVNFTDRSLFDYAIQRSDSIYGGNFTSYIMTLIERDKSLPESQKASSAFADLIKSLLSDFDAQYAEPQSGYDLAIPDLGLIIEAKARFPKGRASEYKMIGDLQKAALNHNLDMVLVFPDNIPNQEKACFVQIKTLEIPSLTVLAESEIVKFFEARAQDFFPRDLKPSNALIDSNAQIAQGTVQGD